MDDEREMYCGFAAVYDTFMDNIPYDDWHDYVHTLLMRQGVCDGIVVELGCGTGSMTRRLAEDGYNMIGVDLSAEMLEYAREKCPESVLLLQQDMCELDLYGTAAAMVCVCDGMNYLIDAEEFVQALKRVHLFLDEGGVFLFDVKTAYFYENQLGSRTVTDNREDATLIWENEYHDDTMIHEYLVTIYRLVDEEKELFERQEEYHRQRAYPWQEIQRMLEQTGFFVEAVYDAFTENTPREDSERLYFVAKKHAGNGNAAKSQEGFGG